MSDAWQRFFDSVTGAIASRAALERYDLGALAALGPDERAKAEALLIGRIATSNDDPRVVAALTQLGTPAARAALASVLASPDASMTRLAAAETARDAAATADVLARTGRDDLRTAAAAIAPTLPKNAALDAALVDAATQTADPVTRHALVDAALTRRGRPNSSRVPPDSSFWVLPLVASTVAAVRAHGFARLASLGPSTARTSPAYDALRDRFADPAMDLHGPVAALSEPVDRAWAVDALVWRLGKGDLRAPAALARIGAAHAVLAAMATEATGPMSTALAQALAATWDAPMTADEAARRSPEVAGALGRGSAGLDLAVVRFFTAHPGAPGGEVLYDALRLYPERFVGVDARAGLFRAALGWGPIPADLLTLFREEVLTPGRAAAVLEPFWGRDRTWAEDNAAAILFANPEAGPIAFREAVRFGRPPEAALDWVLARCERVAGTWDFGAWFDDPVLVARLNDRLAR